MAYVFILFCVFYFTASKKYEFIKAVIVVILYGLLFLGLATEFSVITLKVVMATKILLEFLNHLIKKKENKLFTTFYVLFFSILSILICYIF